MASTGTRNNFNRIRVGIAVGAVVVGTATSAMLTKDMLRTKDLDIACITRAVDADRQIKPIVERDSGLAAVPAQDRAELDRLSEVDRVQRAQGKARDRRIYRELVPNGVSLLTAFAGFGYLAIGYAQRRSRQEMEDLRELLRRNPNTSFELGA